MADHEVAEAKRRFETLRLFWSSRSPFVRKVMVVAHERGVVDRLDLVPTVVNQVAPPASVVASNPFGQIPTLVLDDGTALFDSAVICQYLDGLSPGPRWFPTEFPHSFDALRRHALGNLVLETYLRRYRERLREDRRAAELVHAYRAKSFSALDFLEREIPSGHHPFDIGDVAVAVALSYIDLRYDADSWRHGRPQLAAWYDEMRARPSMVATAFKDED